MNYTMTTPDDFHVHLRGGAHLLTTVPHCAQRFARALVMPNLTQPITTVDAAAEYRARILDALPNNLNLEPLMSLYLTDNMDSTTIKAAKTSGIVYACKLYPAGATTNSGSGVTDIKKIYSTLKTMQEVDLPLLVHGEVTDKNVDIFDREKVFLDTILTQVIRDFPELRIVVEHITTKDAVDFILENKANIAATITAHHLLINRNDIFIGGIQPHHYCLPIAKRQTHQQALIDAATSDSDKFFLGTDSAPHTTSKKESSCGCAGVYTSHAALELYATVFENAKKLEKLEDFASLRGADFYQLPHNKSTITLEKKPWQIPRTYPFGDEQLVPFFANKTLTWQVKNENN